MNKILMIVIAVIVSGCVTIDHGKEPPADWPKLEVETHVVDFFEMQGKCYKYLPTWAKLIGGVAGGCAVVNFKTMRCDVWVMRTDGYASEHENDHCEGRDHGGDTTLADLWANYKKGLNK